jgi:CBS domain containing-hemolysin-like protein
MSGFADVARGRGRTDLSAVRLLSLAATPTFAVMALLTVVHGDGMPDMICSATREGSLLSGMVPMYFLMSAFHLAPWLRLLARR